MVTLCEISKNGVFLGFPFQKLFKEVFGRNVDAFPSFTAMVFSHPGAAF